MLVSSGFHVCKDFENNISYENEKLRFDFAYDSKRSYEVIFSILFKESNLSFLYEELREYFLDIKSVPLTTQIFNDEVPLHDWVIHVSLFLEQNLNKILNNYKAIDTALNNLRLKRGKIYANKRNEQILNEKVDRLWNEKNYIQLVKLLGNHLNQITGSTLAKYHFALKQTKL